MKKKTFAKKKTAHPNAPAVDLFAEPVKQDSGAPAALKAIEAHELKCRLEKDTAHAEWKRAQEKEVEGDDVSEFKERRMHSRYVEALEHWDDATKKLALFDKGVREDRREGEKVSLADVREWIAQLRLCRNITLENYLIGISQQSPTFKAPIDFMKAHGDLIRATEESAIAAAVKEKQLPAWIL